MKSDTCSCLVVLVRERFLNLPFQAIAARLANVKPVHKVLLFFCITELCWYFVVGGVVTLPIIIFMLFLCNRQLRRNDDCLQYNSVDIRTVLYSNNVVTYLT